MREAWKPTPASPFFAYHGNGHILQAYFELFQKLSLILLHRMSNEVSARPEKKMVGFRSHSHRNFIPYPNLGPGEEIFFQCEKIRLLMDLMHSAADQGSIPHQ